MMTTMKWNRKRCLSMLTIRFNSKAKSGADPGEEEDFSSQRALETGSARDDAPTFRLRQTAYLETASAYSIGYSYVAREYNLFQKQHEL